MKELNTTARGGKKTNEILTYLSLRLDCFLFYLICCCSLLPLLELRWIKSYLQHNVGVQEC